MIILIIFHSVVLSTVWGVREIIKVISYFLHLI